MKIFLLIFLFVSDIILVKKVKYVRKVWCTAMDLAKVSAKGQITIPVDVRKKLNIRAGDKVMFVEQNGSMTMINATMTALKEVQDAFAGAAQEAGFVSEEGLIEYLKNLRRERASADSCE